MTVVKGIATGFGLTVLIVGAIGISAAWAGFLIMLLCGVLWHTFGILRPIGFIPAAGIGLLIALLGAAVRGGSIEATELGLDLRKNAQMFVGRHTIPRYRGYMQAQVEKLERGSGQREALVAQHGYDTKFGMHAARLGFQGAELLATGQLALPMMGPAGDWLRAVRRGEVSLEEWRHVIGDLDAKLAFLADHPLYSEGPNLRGIEQWSVRAHMAMWA